MLLPLIANFFEITVDELIGSDEVSRETDIKSFRCAMNPQIGWRWFDRMRDDPRRRFRESKKDGRIKAM